MLKITREQLAENMRAYRLQNKITQTELADYLGCTNTSICKYENCKSIPRGLAIIRSMQEAGIIPK
jgi:predicted transcriptional regulator